MTQPGAAPQPPSAGNSLSGAGEVRDHAGAERDDDLDLRDRSGEARDGAGAERDQAAIERDRTGALRDIAAEERDRAAEEFEAQGRFRSPKGVRRSALARRAAAADREGASDDRRASASERSDAELDRVKAHADRGASARDRRDASVDTLTGVSRRGAGFLALDREVARARRSGQQVLVGFVDVDHLKTVNDGQGHAAGDQMLLEVANTLRAHLRAYDLIFRYGGDEFVCVLAGVDTAFGESRIALVNGELEGSAVPTSVTAGFAELRSGESSADLVGRADSDLYRRRGHVGPDPQLVGQDADSHVR